MGRLIQVFEYDKLTSKSLCNKGKELGENVIIKLWQYNDANKNIYFEAIRHGVKFKNYVGVIQIGGITIEILPKADKNPATKEEKEIWHSVLLKMLGYCKKIKVDAVSEASLRKKYNSLLDLYFELYLSEVSKLLQHGLIKKYSKNTGNVNALKGQLNFGKNIQQNLIRKERFYTNHQVYDYDHLINQILFKAMQVLKTITSNSYLIDSVNRILTNFPEVDTIQINKTHFDKLTTNRKSVSYNEALKIAKMILLNYSPDIKGGDENMLALLFDMNKLWEEYIYRMLLKVDDPSIKVSPQKSEKFWENKIIKPDIVLTKNEIINDEIIRKEYIIDTKWKIINPTEPGDNDLKQMYAYNMYWNAEKSMLLYPSSKVLITNFGKFHKGKQTDNLCKLGFVNVIDNNGNLDSNIGKVVMNLMGI